MHSLQWGNVGNSCGPKGEVQERQSLEGRQVRKFTAEIISDVNAAVASQRVQSLKRPDRRNVSHMI